MAKATQPVTAKVVNVVDERVHFDISTMAGAPGRHYDLAPGEMLELETGYATRRQSFLDRDLQPSIVEMLTGGRVLPISDQRAKEAVRRRAAAIAPPAANDDLTAPGEAVANEGKK